MCYCIILSLQERSENVLYRLKVSFIEIYREEARDLLEFETKDLHIREDDKGNTSKLKIAYVRPASC